MIIAWSDGEIGLNFAVLGDGRVADKKERYEIGWGNHYETLGPKRISCAS